MRTVGTFKEARGLSSGVVGLVPTMGFLHEGHLSLIRAAASGSDTVLVSLFVNPVQFNRQSDLDSYPRDLERDAALAQAAGANVLFAPELATMYPRSPRTIVSVDGVSDGMEGSHRPGHFAGVATVVTKLFAGLQPHVAYFGRKDAQQLAVIRAMASDLSFPVEIVGMPIVREVDGLALSSRNVRIDPSRRSSALGLSSALFAAADAFESGERSTDALRSICRTELASDQEIDVEYTEIAKAADAEIVEVLAEPSFLAVAARVGDVRLIDNIHLDPDSGRADRGICLSEPSTLYGGS